ncbi:hypothetical protein C3F00_038525 [Pseudomonas sp. MWU13-2860]|nr:hypothetical protein C3F00_038525 [Pseudomonas sp. MWU13-2860]
MNLLVEAIKLTGPVPVTLEWDSNFPSVDVLRQTLSDIRHQISLCSDTRA